MTRMERIAGVGLAAKELPSFTWNADLIAYDGPLLSLYTTEAGGDVLFVWLDCDGRGHRWAIVDVTRDMLANYLAQRASLLDVFMRSDSIFVFDQLGMRRYNIVSTSWADLPSQYLPDPDSYLADAISTSEARRLAEDLTINYSIELDGELFIEDLATIPRLYQQLYSFHYGLAHLDREAVRAAIVRSVTRWKGGFNAVNLFSGLSSVIPSVHKPRIKTLQYASPGHIQMELLPEMASQIRAASARLASPDHYALAESLYREIYKYFRANKISGFDKDKISRAQFLSEDQVRVLSDYVSQFIDLLDWSEYRYQFISLEVGPLPQLRALLAYYRRLRRLHAYEDRGLVALT